IVLHDPDPLIAAWACAVSAADDDAEPLWLMLVGPPSGSKSETIRTLSNVWDEQFSEITTAGLLSQKMSGNGRVRPATGLLSRLGDDCN
ncbi:hypothetical protein NL463_28325, partial [Klebsiella pneumoniae]|nr:hypothetical protein [Klebsiella pneumoniae]